MQAGRCQRASGSGPVGAGLVVGDEVGQRLELARLVHEVGPPAQAQGAHAAAVADGEDDVAVAVPADLRVEDERQPLHVCTRAAPPAMSTNQAGRLRASGQHLACFASDRWRGTRLPRT